MEKEKMFQTTNQAWLWLVLNYPQPKIWCTARYWGVVSSENPSTRIECNWAAKQQSTRVPWLQRDIGNYSPDSTPVQNLRYVRTICLAIFYGDIPWKLGLTYMVASSNKSDPGIPIDLTKVCRSCGKGYKNTSDIRGWILWFMVGITN